MPEENVPPPDPVVAPGRSASEEPAPATRGSRAKLMRVLDALQQQAPEQPKLVNAALGQRLILIPGGSFRMGSPPTEPDRRLNEGPVHEVVFDKPIYLGAGPVTQEQYEQLMGSNPSRFDRRHGGGPDHPVESVSWEDAVAFCERLSSLSEERRAGRAYRLPTEAEWEYACRGGRDTAFAYGPTLTAVQANFDNTPTIGEGVAPAPTRTTSVGAYPATNFGLFDLHGNVWEWCADWYAHDYYARTPRLAPPGPPSGHLRVVRGGSWRNHASTCRTAYRNAYRPIHRDFTVGFRVVAVASADPAGR